MYTLPKGLVRVHLRKRKGHSIASAAPISGTSLPLGDKKNRHHNKLPNHYNTGLQQVMFSGQQSQAGRHTPIGQQPPARQVCQVGQQSVGFAEGTSTEIVAAAYPVIRAAAICVGIPPLLGAENRV